MRLFIIYVITTIVIILSINCSTVEINKNSHLTIVNANLLYSNNESKTDITKSLLKKSADVYILIEASINKNVDSSLLHDEGYQFIQSTEELSSKSMIIASKFPGDLGIHKMKNPINNAYNMPTIRITIDTTSFTIFGVHIPAPFYFSEETRNKVFEELSELFSDGKLLKVSGSGIENDPIIMAGDFNSFPTDDRMSIFTDGGLEDGATVSINPYSYTWKPKTIPVNIARIDYCFVSKYLHLDYQEVFEIPGSDHMALITGISLK